MANNIYRRPPMGRISYTDTHLADPDRVRKGQPNLLPVHGRIRGREPQKTKDLSRKTMGIQMFASNRFLALKSIRGVSDIAIRFTRPFKVVEGNPIIQLFVSGPTPNVVEAVAKVQSTGAIIRQFDVERPGSTRPPNIYRDRTVKKRAR